MGRLGDTSLDAMARGLAGGMSRREALRIGGAAFVGAVAMTPADAWAAVTGHCPPHRAKCHGKCCPKGEVCLPPKHKGGKHRCGCPHLHTRCGSSCVNLTSDPHNCGRCGARCATGESCVRGTCTGSTAGCPAGEIMCSGTCVTLASDPANCGACGHACTAGEVCASGQCSTTCPAGQTACGGVCVTLATDPQNCGTCGTACPPGDVCSGGACTSTCAAGETNCSGACVSLSSDPSNCGSCGHACSSGATCVNGACVCPSGTSLCNGQCLPPASNPCACGASATNCNDLPFVADVSCSSGTCSYRCTTNWYNCSTGTPVQTMTDDIGCPCFSTSGSDVCNGTMCVQT